MAKKIFLKNVILRIIDFFVQLFRNLIISMIKILIVKKSYAFKKRLFKHIEL